MAQRSDGKSLTIFRRCPPDGLPIASKERRVVNSPRSAPRNAQFDFRWSQIFCQRIAAVAISEIASQDYPYLQPRCVSSLDDSRQRKRDSQNGSKGALACRNQGGKGFDRRYICDLDCQMSAGRKYEWEIDPDDAKAPTIPGLRETGVLARW